MGRYYVVSQSFSVLENRFPLGTLLVNVGGSVLIGFFYVVIVEKSLIGAEWRSLIVAGFLGAFTTFSSFALEAVLLWQHGQTSVAIVYVASSLFACIAAVSLTMWLAMKLLGPF